MNTAMNKIRNAKYQIGQVVRHRLFPFRGVVFDIDPTFSNTEEWYDRFPADVRPHKDQPFYHLFAENEETEYIAYVSEQNLLPDESGEPVRHPQVAEIFVQGRQRRLPAPLRDAALGQTIDGSSYRSAAAASTPRRASAFHKLQTGKLAKAKLGTYAAGA